jgi:RNA polymerase sigma factor (sigma-70 family)
MKIKTWSDYKYYRKSSSRLILEVENFLISKLQNDREKVIEEFSILYQPIIKSFVKKYLWSNVASEDLYSSGVEGLINSIDNFDSSKNVRFGTYATHYILGNIRRVIDLTNNTIKKPSHVNRILHKVFIYEGEDFYSKLLDDGFTKDQIDNALLAKEIKMTNLEDALEVQKIDEYSIFNNIEILNSVKRLSPREMIAISLKFGLFDVKIHTYKELDKILDCDSELLVRKIYEKLRELMKDELD